MTKKPVLVIMAAGMGSRYGGLKQIDPVGPNGEIIIDYSLYDAKRAGFDTVICIIKPSIEKEFRAIMDRGPAAQMNILYAYQDINDIPAGFSVPDGRVKPWGTAHAILAARELIDSPFAIINADDYYGPEAFRLVYDYLCNAKDGERYDYCMVAYRVENTLSENGSVARGVCTMKNGKLLHIDERTQVQRIGGVISYTDPDGSLHTIDEGTPVSMNLFGFTPGIISELQSRLPVNLERILRENPLKGEFYIPIAASELIEEGKADMTVMTSSDRWYGVTYKEDKPTVQIAMRKKTDEGLYPARLRE